MSAAVASTAQKVDYTLAYSIQVNFASTGGGVPQGTFFLSGCNDGVSFVPIANSSTAITGAGIGMWNVNGIGYDYLTVNFTPLAGSSGSLNATLYSKGF